MSGRVLCVGIAVEDAVFQIPSPLVAGAKNFASSRRVAVGGPAANAARAIASLGGAASLVAPLGDDPTGSAIIDELVESGVDASMVVVRPGVTTPMSTVVVDADGERTIVNQCEDAILATDLTLGADVVGGFDCVLVDVRWQGGSVRALELAAERSVPSVVDVDATDRKLDSRILDLGTHLVFSRDTLETHSGTSDPQVALASVGAQSSGVVAVTLGGAGALLYEAGTVAEVPSFDVDVTETLGAGDVFHGAYALGIARGFAATEAALRASAAAAITCSRPTGTNRFPTVEEVDALVRSIR